MTPYPRTRASLGAGIEPDPRSERPSRDYPGARPRVGSTRRGDAIHSSRCVLYSFIYLSTWGRWEQGYKRRFQSRRAVSGFIPAFMGSGSGPGTPRPVGPAPCRRPPVTPQHPSHVRERPSVQHLQTSQQGFPYRRTSHPEGAASTSAREHWPWDYSRGDLEPYQKPSSRTGKAPASPPPVLGPTAPRSQTRSSTKPVIGQGGGGPKK